MSILHILDGDALRAGAVVRAGRADQVALNGIDRWLGATHLTADHYWR